MIIRLFIREWDRRRDWLQTTAEHDVESAVNYLVQTWMENTAFMCNLTSWSVPFWLVLLSEHKSFTASRRTRSAAACLVEGQSHRANSFQQTIDAFKFPTLVGKFTKQCSCPWQTEIFNQNCIFLWNVHYCRLKAYIVITFGAEKSIFLE